ncbi:hypothetical protein C8J56DRAFT_1090390 [Mycena floridula]|nr:hypothetical protein C8J56DRAFT_1090390 [Mycena floridula]
MSDLELIDSPDFQRQPVGVALCAALGYGSYSVLAIIAIYVLIRRGGLYKSLARRVLLGFIITMFLATTACFVADAGMTILQDELLMDSAIASSQSALMARNWKRFGATYAIMSHIVFLMSDMIVVWRAWVICDRRSVQAALSFCILGSIVGIVIHVEKQLTSYLEGFSIIITIVAFLLPLALTNFVATSAIAYKAWICRVSVRKHLSNTSQMTRAEKVLLLLLESGAAYLAGWIVIVILLLLGPSTHTIYLYATELSPYCVAIHPAIIILLVTGRDAPCETAFKGGVSAVPSSSSSEFIDNGTPDSAATPITLTGLNGASRGEAESKDIPSLTV